MEKDLEDAILRELERFLLELGSGFTFQARQFRISIDSDDFYLDLLFYHRALRRLVAIELKLGDFKPEYKGQMELYLRWLAKHEQQSGEEPPLGLILCAGKKKSKSNYSNWANPASTSPNTSPPSHPANSSVKNSTPPSKFPGPNWKTKKEAKHETILPETHWSFF